jgi:hypothetical protein
VQGLEVDSLVPGQRLDRQHAPGGQIGDGFFDYGRLDFQDRNRPLHQLLARAKDVPFIRQLVKHVQHSRLGPPGGIGGNAEFFGNLVRRLETDPEDVHREPVWVFFYDGDGPLAVLRVDLHGVGRRDAVGLEKDHHRLDLALLRPCLPNSA